MGTYRKKLLHHYDELNRRQKLRYYLTDRFLLSKQDRFFFEGCKGNPGQMFLAERKELYQSILRFKPAHCFEVGTFTGGGSTYFLASAFAKLGRGKVITMERDVSRYEHAKNFYKTHLQQLMPFVELIRSRRIEDFRAHIDQNCVECFFLDGAEDGEETLVQYRFFEPFCRAGTILMAHDWNTEKMRLLRSLLLEPAPCWTLEVELGEPVSPGFVVMRRR